MKKIFFLSVIVIFYLIGCSSTTPKNTEWLESSQTESTLETSDSVAQIKALTVAEIEQFCQIIEQDVKSFTMLVNHGTIFRGDSLGCDEEDNIGRTYAVGFGVKQIGKVTVVNEDGKSYALNGGLYLSRVELSYPKHDSVVIDISLGGHLNSKDYKTFMPKNQFIERWVRLRKGSGSSWILLGVMEHNPKYEAPLYADDADPINNPEYFTAVCTESVPSGLESRLNTASNLVLSKALSKVTSCN